MNIVLIIIFLLVLGYIVYYIINLLVKKRVTESFTDDLPQKMTINDSHYFLTTSILPGKTAIANLKETNPSHTQYYYVDDQFAIIEQTNPNVVSHKPSKLSHVDLTCIKATDPINTLIGKYQPYMYDKPEIIHYYDYPYYRDWRYPERPIDIRFAANPEKYAQLYPHIYPSYKYLSKW